MIRALACYTRGWAMRALRRAVLRPYGLSPQAVSGLRRAATIAGAGLFLFVFCFVLPAIFAGA